ncbi:hypothetical protein PQR05_29495 [Paraburkholderia sediminicola]|uniref:hypothetical protein n=1 Tax=Paraburkholderia sediminicola TaxID=458836 RepID=UPI0038B82F8B
MGGAGVAVLKTTLNKFVPGAAGKYGGAISKALSGDFLGAGIDAIRQTGVGKTVNELLHGSVGTDLAWDALPNPLLGGITPFEAQQIVQKMQSTAYAKKNLYFLEVVDFDQRVGMLGASSGIFNFFCTAISITPPHLTGEAHSIGSGAMDSLTGMERGEIRITTLDDADGQIKRWFNLRKRRAALPDGTFGVPSDYLVLIRILHAALNDEVMAMYGGYEEIYVARPVSLETELSRADDGLQEIQLAFSQFDTFMYDQE